MNNVAGATRWSGIERGSEGVDKDECGVEVVFNRCLCHKIKMGRACSQNCRSMFKI